MVSLFLSDPVAYVRNGGATGLGSIAPDHPVWMAFAEAMIPVMTPVARLIAREVAAWSSPPQRILDIAAGHGIFGITVARALPQAELVAVDWPHVLEIARGNAEKAGVGSRLRTVAGSAFEVDWGNGYDLVLLANFLHHFDRAACVDLLRKIRASLAPNGRTLAVEFVPNEDRVSPPFQASFAFYMLGSTPNGDAFTANDFNLMARDAGYRRADVSAVPRSPQSLVWFTD
jgi:ubiquinone/menaquinone biosynthesis C-methylase UbiE